MSVTGQTQIDLDDGEVERIIRDEEANRAYLVEVTGSNPVRVGHTKRYARDGNTLSGRQTHTVSNLRGQELYAAAFDGPTSIRVRVAAADVDSQPPKDVTILEGDVRIADDLDISDRPGREIGKSRLQDSDGVLIDPATDGTLSETLPRSIEGSITVDDYTGSDLPVSVEIAEITEYSGSTLPVDVTETDPIHDTTTGTGDTSAATLQLDKRSNVDVAYDLSGSASVTTEVSTDGSTWLFRDAIDTDGEGSILMTVAFPYVRVYADSNVNQITIAAKGGT